MQHSSGLEVSGFVTVRRGITRSAYPTRLCDVVLDQRAAPRDHGFDRMIDDHLRWMEDCFDLPAERRIVDLRDGLEVPKREGRNSDGCAQMLGRVVLTLVEDEIGERGARRRRSSEQAIWEEVLDRFAACDDIDFAYPTQRFYDNVVEGKKRARAESTTLP